MARSFAFLSIAIYLTICSIQGSIQALNFLEEPTDSTVTEGGKVTLKCSVDDDKASVLWFKDKKKVEEEYNNAHIIILADNSLKFENIRKSDAGKYYCQAENRNGDDSVQSKTVTLTVEYICDDSFKIKSADLVFRGQNVTLVCDCSSVPAPTYSWTKDGTALSDIMKKHVIQNVSLSASGNYKCFATNGKKTVSSQPYPLKVIDGIPPKIITPPKDKIAFVLKSDVMIDCVATGDPKPEVRWYFGKSNKPLKNNSLRHIFPNGSLHLEDLHRKNAGQYKCVAENKYQASKFYTSRLVQAKIGEIPAISDLTVQLGSTLSIKCDPPVAVPDIVNIKWLRSSQPLSNDSRIKVNGNTLKIEDTLKSDSGIYTCVAKNIAGVKKRDVEVTIAVFPKVEQDPKNQTVIEGKNATLTCKFSGDPKPTITWEKNRKNLPADSTHYTITGSTLTINSVTTSDNGLYRCSANLRQVITERTKEAAVKIREKISIAKADDNKFDEGSVAKVHCRVRGEGPWNIIWSRQGGSKGLPSHMEVKGTVLYINKAKLSDTGNYTCTANNSFSRASMRIPVYVYRFPVFVIRPRNITVEVTGTAVFDCGMTGLPKPKILWYKKGKKRWNQLSKKDDSRVTVLENGSLQLVNVRSTDQLFYRCLGGNPGNIIQATAFLQVKAKDEESSDNMGKTVGIAVGCAGAYIILVVGLMIYCKGRRARQTKNKLVLNGEDVPLNAVDGENAEVMKTPDSKLLFPRQNLEALRTLGSGSYGNVFLAKASDIVEGETTSIVVVQSLTSKEENVKKDFMKIMEMLSLKHANIAKLLGVCREEEPMYLISEYPEQGDLKTVMRDSSTPLTPTQKVNVCAAVASGMNYLSNHGHVHKDLAARNCLVNKSFDVKISFLSLNQGTYPKEYYRRDEELIPLRWMAPEALKGQFSDTSDVWSFGVFMWEVYTEGVLPYEERSDEEVLKCVPYDLRLTKPEGCPGKIFKMMEQCWEEENDVRPTFGQLCEDFSEIPREGEF